MKLIKKKKESVFLSLKKKRNWKKNTVNRQQYQITVAHPRPREISVFIIKAPNFPTQTDNIFIQIETCTKSFI